MFQQHRNTKKQGDAGLGIAIGWFSEQGLTVSVPLTDSQDYDLLVDSLDGLDRVQVKTTSYIRKGKYEVSLSVKGGNKTRQKTKRLDPTKVDSVYVITADGDKYWIPVTCLGGYGSIVLGDSYTPFRVD